MQLPFKLDIQYVRLFGSCNGLVFLLYDPDLKYNSVSDDFYFDRDIDDEDYYSETDSDDYCLYNCPDTVSNYDGGGCKDFLCVWNPATGEYKKIQSPNRLFDYFCNRTCMNGLGYDCKDDDYKFIIGISPIIESLLSTSVGVFSLRLNSWKTIQTPYKFTNDEQKSGLLVNDDLHWLAKGQCGVCIVYLDSSSDAPSFKEIQLPDIPTPSEFITIAVLEEGCLSVLVVNGEIPVGFDRAELWEMKVYGVRESWTKRYVITTKAITNAIMGNKAGMKILWSYKNGKIVFLVSNSTVVLYDPKHETVVRRTLLKFAKFTSEVNYLESLVSLNPGTSVGSEKRGGHEE